MNNIYVSNKVHTLFRFRLEQLGYQIVQVLDSPFLSEGIASHADLFMCKMGCGTDSPIFFGDPSKPKTPYPEDATYNAACTGSFFIHRLAISDSELLQKAIDMDMVLIDVRQGYAKCNVVVVNENSLITSDKGIYNVLGRYLDIDCLLVQSGYVALSGYSTGFIGGASGRIGNCVYFHGNLKGHPDFDRIIKFIKERDLEVEWFEDFPLTDIGSILEAGRCSK